MTKSLIIEMLGKEPKDLQPEAKKLFDCIMGLCDENDYLRKQIDDMDFEYQKLEEKYQKLEKKYQNVVKENEKIKKRIH